MKLNLSVDVPTLSQDEQHDLCATLQTAKDKWLWYRAVRMASMTAFWTDEDKKWLKEAHISA